MEISKAKREILEAAAECFMEQGFNATSIDVVARRMGYTKGRVYHHYQSKVDLFFDVHRLGMSLLFDAVEPVQNSFGDPLETLSKMLRAHALALLEHHTFESVVVQGVQLHRFGALTPRQRSELEELISSRDRFEKLFTSQVRLAAKAGQLEDLNIPIAVKTMLGGLQWSLIWYRPEINHSKENREKIANSMVQTLVNGLRRRLSDLRDSRKKISK